MIRRTIEFAKCFNLSPSKYCVTSADGLKPDSYVTNEITPINLRLVSIYIKIKYSFFWNT